MKNFLLNSGILFALIGCSPSMNKVLPTNASDTNQTVKKEDSTAVVPSDTNQTVKKEDTPMVLSNDEKIKALYEKSISLIRSEDFENAYKNLEEISHLCTNDNKELLSMCAKSLYNKGVIEENNNKSATESYEEALKYGFKDKTKVYNKLAYSYYNESKFEQALPYLLELRNLNDVTVNYMIGFSYINLNDKSSAKEFILKAKNAGNKNAETLWFKHELYGY